MLNAMTSSFKSIILPLDSTMTSESYLSLVWPYSEVFKF